MTAVEGGDFEDGRPAHEPDPRGSRPGRACVADAADAPRPAGATDRSSTASPTSCGRRGSNGSGSRPTDVQAPQDALRGDRRGRADRPRPGQPVHEPPAEPPDPRHPRRRLPRGAPRIFVCNVATQEGETTGFDLARTSTRSSPTRARMLIDVVLANNHFCRARRPRVPPRRGRRRRRPSRLRWPPSSQPAPRLILDDVVDPADAHHHDPVRLAAAVMRALEREAGIRRPAPPAGRRADGLT